MNKLLQRLSGKNITAMRIELAHAHLIIALLSFALITMLAMGATQPVAFDETLSAVCIALLTIVAIASLCISITFYRKK